MIDKKLRGKLIYYKLDKKDLDNADSGDVVSLLRLIIRNQVILNSKLDEIMYALDITKWHGTNIKIKYDR